MPKPHANQDDFLPNLCSVQAVFHLVLVGELLAFALTIADSGVSRLSWYTLGVLSMLIQWIVLTSAACLCPMRHWFKRQPPLLAGSVAYGMVMLVTVVYTMIGTYISTDSPYMQWEMMLDNIVLAALFSGIVLRYFYLQQQLRNQQQAELRARIQALQSRIRPHFLFNSMNSIASLIDFDPVTAERMVVDLADLFRASLSEPGLISLKRELELCERFVYIEQTRIGDRLNVEWELDYPEDAQIPSLLLQPLVENAIYHGIQPLPEGGTVTIHVDCDAKNCHIWVINPIANAQQAHSEGNGIALDNIRHRLEAYYDGHAQLSARTNDKSYKVSLSFPHSPKSELNAHA